jgi:hypothetical protein
MNALEFEIGSFLSENLMQGSFEQHRFLRPCLHSWRRSLSHRRRWLKLDALGDQGRKVLRLSLGEMDLIGDTALQVR